MHTPPSPSKIHTPHVIRIATRESPLALWQARHVADRFRQQWPDCSITLVPMTTRGDKILDRTLSKVGGKGLFIRELEQALLDDRADIAVHSLKDVPMVLPKDFILSAILPREIPNDVFISPHYSQLKALPKGACIGTASLRRTALLRTYYPNLQVIPIRGNLDTRLRKLDQQDYDAILLAGAGLIRMGYHQRIREYLDPQYFIPSPGQGAIAIEVKTDDTNMRTITEALRCPITTLCCEAERAFARLLQGGCELPLAAYAQFQTNHQAILLQGWLAMPDGSMMIADHRYIELPTIIEAKTFTPLLAICQKAGSQLAQDFINKNALQIINKILAQK